VEAPPAPAPALPATPPTPPSLPLGPAPGEPATSAAPPEPPPVPTLAPPALGPASGAESPVGVTVTPPVLVAELPPVAAPTEVPPPPVAALIRRSGTESPPLQAAKLETRAKTKPDGVGRRMRAFYVFTPIEAIASKAPPDVSRASNFPVPARSRGQASMPPVERCPNHVSALRSGTQMRVW